MSFHRIKGVQRIKNRNLKLFSRNTYLEVCAGISINLTSGWFGIVLISPGLFGVSNSNEYVSLRTLDFEFALWYIGITNKPLANRREKQKEEKMNFQHAQDFLSLTSISYMVFMIGILIFAAVVILTERRK